MTDYSELKRLAEALIKANDALNDHESLEKLETFHAADEALQEALPPESVLAMIAEVEHLTVVAQTSIAQASEAAKEMAGARMTLGNLKAENEALRKDAERYRWLRDACGVVAYKKIAGSIGPGMLPSGERLDCVIDAVMVTREQL